MKKTLRMQSSEYPCIIAAPVDKKEQNENDCLLVAAVASMNHGSILGAEKLSEWRVVRALSQHFSLTIPSRRDQKPLLLRGETARGNDGSVECTGSCCESLRVSLRNGEQCSLRGRE